MSRANTLRIGATALVVLLGALSGCQAVQSSTPTQTLVRVIDASYNAPAVDVKIGATAIATNIGPATITNYAFLPPQNTTAYIDPTGSAKTIASVSGEFLVDEQHSVFLADSGAGYSATILTDQVTAPPAGYFSIRFLQQALHTGPVDVYLVPTAGTLSGSKPLLSGVTPASVSGYINVLAGAYTLAVTPAGVITTPYTSAPLTFAAGQVRTALIMDAALTTNPPVTVTVGNDLN